MSTDQMFYWELWCQMSLVAVITASNLGKARVHALYVTMLALFLGPTKGPCQRPFRPPNRHNKYELQWPKGPLAGPSPLKELERGLWISPNF